MRDEKMEKTGDTGDDATWGGECVRCMLSLESYCKEERGRASILRLIRTINKSSSLN